MIFLNYIEQFSFIFSTTDIVPIICILLTIFNLLKYSWLPILLFIHNRRLDILKENLFIELDYLLIIMILKKSIFYYIIKLLYYKDIYLFYINNIFLFEHDYFNIFYDYDSFDYFFFEIFHDLIINNLLFIYLFNIFKEFNNLFNENQIIIHLYFKIFNIEN
jgi:hypothetical protein